MTLEQLRQKVEKKQAEAKALEKQLKDEEKARTKADELFKKLEGLTPEISKAIQDILDKAKVSLPEGKQIITTTGETGISTSIVNTKSERTGRGGGAKTITFDGKQMSWAKLCTLKNVVRTPGGSAHRDVYNKSRELHDSIEHECVIDGKKYPVTNS